MSWNINYNFDWNELYFSLKLATNLCRKKELRIYSWTIFVEGNLFHWILARSERKIMRECWIVKFSEPEHPNAEANIPNEIFPPLPNINRQIFLIFILRQLLTNIYSSFFTMFLFKPSVRNVSLLLRLNRSIFNLQMSKLDLNCMFHVRYLKVRENRYSD